MTRPITPRSQVLGHNRQTYVVCLDCGTELGYDLAAMRAGKSSINFRAHAYATNIGRNESSRCVTLTTVPTEIDRQIVSAAENKETSTVE